MVNNPQDDYNDYTGGGGSMISLAAGNHIIRITDEQGVSVSRSFEIIDKERK